MWDRIWKGSGMMRKKGRKWTGILVQTAGLNVITYIMFLLFLPVAPFIFLLISLVSVGVKCEVTQEQQTDSFPLFFAPSITRRSLEKEMEKRREWQVERRVIDS